MTTSLRRGSLRWVNPNLAAIQRSVSKMTSSKIWCSMSKKISWIEISIRDIWSKCKRIRHSLIAAPQTNKVWHLKMLQAWPLEVSNRKIPPKIFTIKRAEFLQPRTSLPSRLTVRRLSRSSAELRSSLVRDTRVGPLRRWNLRKATQLHLSVRQQINKNFSRKQSGSVFWSSTICRPSNPSWNNPMKRLRDSTARTKPRKEAKKWEALSQTKLTLRIHLKEGLKINKEARRGSAQTTKIVVVRRWCPIRKICTK